MTSASDRDYLNEAQFHCLSSWFGLLLMMTMKKKTTTNNRKTILFPMSLLDTLTNCTKPLFGCMFLVDSKRNCWEQKMRSIKPPSVFCNLNEKRTGQSTPEPIHYIHVGFTWNEASEWQEKVETERCFERRLQLDSIFHFFACIIPVQLSPYKVQTKHYIRWNWSKNPSFVAIRIFHECRIINVLCEISAEAILSCFLFAILRTRLI